MGDDADHRRHIACAAGMATAHDRVGDVLRQQRITRTQRELLLDSMVRNMPVAMILLDMQRIVAFGDFAARKLPGEGNWLEGRRFDALGATVPAALRKALAGTVAATTRTSTICRGVGSVSRIVATT